MWKILYKKSVEKDLRSISKDNQYFIRRAIEDKLMVDPVKFGIPLRRNLKGFRKLRVGELRIIYSIEKETITIYVVKIGHRKDVYND